MCEYKLLKTEKSLNKMYGKLNPNPKLNLIKKSVMIKKLSRVNI